MSNEQSNQLVGIFKTIMKDTGLPRCLDEINDPAFQAAAAAHIDEFEEACAECETDLLLA